MMKNVLLILLFWAAVIAAQANSNGPVWVENRGQVVDTRGFQRPEITHSADLGWANVYLSGKGMHYVLRKSSAVVDAETTPDTKYLRVDVEFIGANPKPEVVGSQRFSENLHFISASSNVSTQAFGEVRYLNIYSNIDLVFYSAGTGSTSTMKYDFIVHEGGNPADIQIRYKGLQEALITREGDLHVSTILGDWLEEAPVSYMQNGISNEVFTPSFYEWNNGILTFQVIPPTAGQTLRIDPLTRSYATNYGSSAPERIQSTTIDASGNITVTGYAAGSAFPTTPGVVQTVFGGQQDVFVTRFDVAGQRVWSTYYGGSSLDQGFGIAQASGGRVAVVGYTTSSNLNISPNAFSATYSGSGDGFIAYFNNDGTLNWATYLGGNRNDQLTGVSVSAAGDIYVVGRTYSNGLATIAPNVVSGSRDFYIARFSSTGQRQWSRYYGGSDDDQALAVSVANGGNSIYVTGLTSSSGLSTPGTAQTSNNGSIDALLVKFDAAGSRQWATYFGGSVIDYASALVSLPTGGVSIAGQTSSSNLRTLNAAQTVLGGQSDAFVANFNDSGVLTMATFLGGSGADQALGLAFANDQIYVAGRSNSLNYPLLNPLNPVNLPLQTTSAGFLDIVLASYNSVSGAQNWSLIYGGASDDVAQSIAANANGRLALGGYTNSGNISRLNPVTGQPVAGLGNDDGFVLVFDDNDNQCPTLTVEVITTNPLCPNTTDGRLQVVSPLGSSFRYSIGGAQTVTEQVSPIFEGLLAGNYSVSVLNTSNGCSYEKANLALVAQQSIGNVSVIPTQSSCSGDNKGRILIINPVLPSVMYTLTGPVNRPAQSSPVFENLTPGTYIVSANNESACSAVSSGIQIVEPTPIVLIATGSTGPCTLVSGVIQITTATGGTGALRFQVQGLENRPPQTNRTFTDLPAGSYTVIAEDANGCSVLQTVSINTVDGPRITVASTPSTCGGANGSVQVTNISSSPVPLLYLLNGPVSFPITQERTFNGLLPGVYSLTAINPVTSCIDVVPITIGIETSFVTVSPPAMAPTIKCAGDKVTLNLILQGQFPIELRVNNVLLGTASSSPYLLEDVPAGNLIITATDDFGCSGSVEYTIADILPLTFSSVVTRIACPTPEKGTVVIMATGGTAPIQYQINSDPFVSTSSFGNLEAGIYTFTVRDNNNCAPQNTSQTVFIAPVSRPTISNVVKTTPKCVGSSNGNIAVSVVGTGPFEYEIAGRNPVASTSNIFAFDNLAAGGYDIIVRDVNGCQTQITETLNNPEPFLITQVLTTQPSSCLVEDGQIRIQTSGGVGTLWYSINGGITFQTSLTFNLIPAGFYNIVVRDRNRGANACLAETTTVINHRNAPTILSVIAIDPLCSNTNGTNPANNSGQIVISASGSSPLVFYSINAGVTYLGSNTGNRTFLNQQAGTYNVRVSNANGCTSFHGPVTLKSPPPLVVNNVSRVNPVCGASPQPGSLNIIASGGTVPYQYSIDAGASYSTSNMFSPVYPNLGGYNVLLRDANGCQVNGGVYLLFNSSGLVLNQVTSSPPTCGNGDGTITVQVTGGSSPRFYSVNGGTETSSSSSSFTFTGLTNAQHTVRVRDNNNCIVESRQNLQTLTAEVMVTKPDCGLNNGQVSVMITGGTGPFEYILTGQEFTSAFSAPTPIPTLPSGPVSATSPRTAYPFSFSFFPGVYTLEVRDLSSTSNCVIRKEVVIENRNANISIVNVIGQNRNCNFATSTFANESITVVATGNVLGYQLVGPSPQLQFPGTNAFTFDVFSVFGGLQAGTYRPFAFNATCIVAGNEVTLTEPAPVIITNVTTVQPTCTTPKTGSITVVAQGGTNLEYTFDGGLTFQPSPTLSNISSNTFFAGNQIQSREIGTAACVNFWPLFVNITNGSPLDILPIASTIPVTCPSKINGGFDVTVIGGVPPYTYTLNGVDVASNSTGMYTYIGLPASAANAYEAGVRDANGCFALERLSLAIVEQLFDVNVQTFNVTGCNDGRIRLTLVNVSQPAPYRYSINGGTSFVNSNNIIRQFTNLAPGTYQVSVEQGTGNNICRLDRQAVVGGTSAITGVSIVPIQPSCQGSMDGSVVVTATFANASVANPAQIIFNGMPATPAITSPGTVTRSIMGRGAGTVTIELRDGAGVCILNALNSSNLDVTLVDPPLLVVTNASFTPITCGATPTLGSITVTVNAPSATIVYSVNGGVTTQSNNVFSNLPAGIYNVQARNVNSSCPPATWPVPIVLSHPSGIAITGVSSTANSCTQTADATLTVNLSIPTISSYPVQIFLNSALVGTLTNPTTSFMSMTLASGLYNIRVLDNLGCMVETATTISNLDDLSVATSTVQPSNCALASGSITFAASGGNDALAGNREYRLTSNGFPGPWQPVNAGTPSTPSQTLSSLSSGVYMLAVRNTGTGCLTSRTILLQDPTGVGIATVNSGAASNASCNNGFLQPVLQGSGVNIRYELSSDGASWTAPQTSSLFLNLTQGSYFIRVRTGVQAPFCYNYGGPYVVGCTVGQKQSTFDIVENSSFSVYPNPTRDRVTVSFLANETGDFVLTVRDLQGRSIKQQVESASEGNNNWNIDLSDLSSGMYLIEVKGARFSETLRVVRN